MEQSKQAIFDFLLSREGVKSTNRDLKRLCKYYSFTIGNKSAFCEHSKQLRLPEELLGHAKRFGFWSIYLGDPEGVGRTPLIRNMLRDSYFREFLQYSELLRKDARAEYVHDMEEELKNTQEMINGFYQHPSTQAAAATGGRGGIYL